MYGILNDESAQAEPKFKVGQRVQFTDAVDGHWWFKAGEGGVVESAERFGGFQYTVRTGDRGQKCHVNDEHIQPAFLPGDRVRVTRHSGYFAAGDIGEVERQTDHAVFIKHGSYQRIGLPIHADALDLVTEPEPTWSSAIDTSGFATGVSFSQSQPCIVARVLDGQPRPSNIPFVHSDVAVATTEAERLARNNPGQEFAVYQRVAGRVAEVSYSMKEVA